MTWVKVDHVTVDTFYRHMRCICIVSVQEEIVNLGGENKAIELGVISLGTTTTDGNRREVKVEVLGVLERGTGRMRLRATEPIAGTNQAERFARIFKPLPTWDTPTFSNVVLEPRPSVATIQTPTSWSTSSVS